MFFAGANTIYDGLYIICANNSGTVHITDIKAMGNSVITLSTSTNTLTITNSASESQIAFGCWTINGSLSDAT